MVTFKLLLAASALVGFVAAQNASLTIDPNSVEQSTRQSWCTGERNTCTQLCGGPGTTSKNDCSAQLLTYNCTCVDNTVPKVEEYQQSLPAQICLVWVAQCVEAHPNDLDGITKCRSTKCGNKTISDTTTASSSAAATSTSAAATSSDAKSSAASATAASATSSSSSAAAATAIALAKTYGTGALAAGMMAAFGLAL